MSKLPGHLAAFGTYAIFGFNIIFCKDIIACGLIPPIALTTFRALGAGLLFWLLSLFAPHERVVGKDLMRIALASILGFFVPQFTFLTACDYTTTIDNSLLCSLTPVMTMFVAAIFLKEPITWKKALGVALSFGGVILLILSSNHAPGAVDHTTPLGVGLLLLNTFSFALYLGIFRPLVARYSVVTYMKWIFLFVFLFNLPLSLGRIVQIPYAEVPTKVYWETAYLIVLATFVAYFLLPIAQKRIRPTLISLYSYLQPIIASIVAIVIGTDHLTWAKAAAVVAVCLGVYVVNKSRAAAQ